MGEALFIRTPRGMRLSDAGRLFRPYAERAPAVSTYVLPAVPKRFMRHHPQVEVAVRTGHSEQILGLVLGDSVQLGLTRALNHPDLESTHLYQDTLVLVCASHSAHGRRTRGRDSCGLHG